MMEPGKRTFFMILHEVEKNILVYYIGTILVYKFLRSCTFLVYLVEKNMTKKKSWWTFFVKATQNELKSNGF